MQKHYIIWLLFVAVALTYGNKVVEPVLNYSSSILAVDAAPKGIWAIFKVIMI